MAVSCSYQGCPEQVRYVIQAGGVVLVGAERLTRWPATNNPDLVISWALCEPHGGPLINCGRPHGIR